MSRPRIILGFIATVVIACGAMDAPRTLLAPMESTASLALDSTHAAIQRRRLDTLAVDLARYCQTKGSKGYLCDDRASLDSARSLEVYVAPLPAPVDTTPAPPPPTPTPTPTPAPTPTGIRVLPGQSIQAAVDANPAGTTFILATGTHTGQSVIPKDNDTFRGELGTVLDGQNVTPYAFNGYTGSRWVNGVTIRTLTVTRYAPSAQMGAIRGIDYDGAHATSGWTLDSVEVSYSKNLGVKVGNRWRVLRSNLHHNGTINIGGSGVGILVDGTRVTDGNTGCPNNPGFESGGSKFSGTDSLIVRNSTFSSNCGPGLWLDIENKNYLLERNTVEDNYREGIVTEISYAGVIRNNAVNRNGWPVDPFRGNGWGWDAGIGIHASSDVEVYGNTLVENFNGIILLQQNRGTGSTGLPYLVQNANVHDNTITQRVGPSNQDGGWAAGAVQDVSDNAVFTSRNNHFTHNTYTLGSNPAPFAWLNGGRTAAQWKGYGQDVTGSFAP
jgi:parallel beta-helix repeat protein